MAPKFVVELYDGSFYRKIVRPVDGLGIISPFAPPPKTEGMNIVRQGVLDEFRPKKNYLVNNEASRAVSLVSYCSKCRESSSMGGEDIREGYESCLDASEMLHCLVLSDCSNAIASIGNINTKCSDKCAKLQLAYIRDAQQLLSVSFVCVPMNLGDVGTKMQSKLAI